jgi:iron complex outermembrane receptor protein
MNRPRSFTLNRSIFLSGIFLLSLILAGTAFSQDEGQTSTVKDPSPVETVPAAPTPSAAPIATEVKAPTVSAEKAEKIEKVEVTGSHIRRLDTEGVSPVTTINRKELEKSGYNSVSDVLRDTTANSFGSAREQSGSNAAGVAEVDLRGLGSSNTLVLLNGQRLPTDAVTGAVDLNLIPMAAIERVEILKDGASAIYGSDALGGVVNIITRKDFNGNQISFTQTVPEMTGGKKSLLSLVNGINHERFNMVNVLQYRNNGVIYSRDRSWSNHNLSDTGSPGTYQSDTDPKSHADPNCPASRIKHTPDGDVCTYNTSDYSTELPALQQYSFLSESNFELSSAVKMTARVGASEKFVQWSYAPAPGSFVIPGATANHLGPGGTQLPNTNAGEDLTAYYRLQELGTRDTQITTKSYNLLLGSQIQVSENWSLDVNLSHNMVFNRDEGVNGYALISTVKNDVNNGSFNPFGTPGSRGSLENARYNPIEETISQLSSADVKATGEIGKLSGGPIGLALGSTFTFQKFADNFDTQSVAHNVYGNAGSSGGGQRDTRAVYSELSLPVLKQLEFQVAGRYDHYSDFGDTANPKLALLYHASPEVLIRASWGTGFKAPLMQDLYAATANGYQTFVDAVACKKQQQAGGDTPACLPAQYNVTSGGNKGLKQETSNSYNLGAVYEPTRDFNIGSDFFLTMVKNVVGINYDDAMIAEANGVDLSKYGVIVHRDATTGKLVNIEAPMQNLSSQQVSGVDLSSSYRIRNFKLSDEHSQLFYFKEEGFPGIGGRDKLGEHGRPAWRNTAGLNYSPGEGQDLSLSALTTAGQTKSVSSYGKTINYTEYDLAYVFKTKTWGTFSAGIKNVLGTTPPLDESTPTAQLDTTLYDQIGRQYIAGYQTSF